MSISSDPTYCFDFTKLREALLTPVSTDIEQLHTELTDIKSILAPILLSNEQLHAELSDIKTTLTPISLGIEEVRTELSDTKTSLITELTDIKTTLVPVSSGIEQLHAELASIHQLLNGQLTLEQLREELAKLQNSMNAQTGKKTITFTQSGTFTPPQNIQWTYIILWGAGAGGSYYGNIGQPGENSSFGSITAEGGAAQVANYVANGGGRAHQSSFVIVPATATYSRYDTITDMKFGPEGYGGGINKVSGGGGIYVQNGKLNNKSSGGGSFLQAGYFDDAGYIAPVANGGGGGGAVISPLLKNFCQGGGGGEIVYGIVPVNNGPIEIVIGKGGAGAAPYGYDGADGGCIIMY